MTDQGYRSMREGEPDFAYDTRPLPPAQQETKLPPPLPESSVTQHRLSEADKLVERIEEIARQNYSLARGECRGHIPEYLAQHWEELPAEQRELFVNLGISCAQLGRELKS